uniref:Exosome component 1 n=1 Tax=Nothoprocta perdicaria TaxID=30464 RepID=A0A8C6ZEG9_NOTPE
RCPPCVTCTAPRGRLCSCGKPAGGRRRRAAGSGSRSAKYKHQEQAGVCSINSRFAKVHILYVGSTPLKSTFRGTIRKEDIRATEKDKVEVYKSFRPGDIVLAKVISLGDAQSNYLLSTAENELGVVVARSEAGVQMVPISWCEMQCPRTHTKDFRKVARVQPQFLQT